MKALQHIVIFEGCFICGDELTLYTDADQSECEGNGWSYCATEDDTVQCSSCGAIGWITIDDQDASVNYDEESEHNEACRKAYEARKE
jgi:Zn finger protein HypA/HybF involved in hydrogenase expression